MPICFLRTREVSCYRSPHMPTAFKENRKHPRYRMGAVFEAKGYQPLEPGRVLKNELGNPICFL